MSLSDILENADSAIEVIITHKSFEHVFTNLSKIQLAASTKNEPQ